MQAIFNEISFSVGEAKTMVMLDESQVMKDPFLKVLSAKCIFFCCCLVLKTLSLCMILQSKVCISLKFCGAKSVLLHKSAEHSKKDP